jgi:hypothetical protein
VNQSAVSTGGKEAILPPRMKSPAFQTVLYHLISAGNHIEAFVVEFPQRYKILLRSIGLGLLARIRDGEPRKILVYRSRLLALAHCAVHLIPAAGSFALIALNFQGRFIGAELQGSHWTTDDVKLALIQVAAKLHVRFGLSNWTKTNRRRVAIRKSA